VGLLSKHKPLEKKVQQPSSGNGKRLEVRRNFDISAPVLGNFGDLSKIVTEKKVSKVVIALQERRGNLPLRDLLDCRFNGVYVEDSPSFYEEMTGKIPIVGLYPS